MDQLWHIVLAWIAAMATWILTTAALLLVLPDPDTFTHPAVSIGTAVWAVAVGIGVYPRLHRSIRADDGTGAHTHPGPRTPHPGTPAWRDGADTCAGPSGSAPRC